MPPDTTHTEPALELRGISKYFGDLAALRGVTLRIVRGESVLIYGPNGAGKTTLLRTLASLAQPTEGEIWMGGLRTDRHPATCKARVGFVSHATFLYNDLTVRENLALAGRLFGLRDVEKRVERALELFKLRDRAGFLIRNLSRGLQQRVTLARALLHDPDFLLLDEPFTGLDAESTANLENLLRKLSEQGKALVFSTHRFAQGASIAQRLVALEKGRINYDGPLTQASLSSLRIDLEEATIEGKVRL
ncbi:MAG TPA: ABC transporter ATP-binding protein [Terriglobia bacterium]|nr:ABC transporter ATP-binding protein [Terriglobia bacterium]